MKIKNPTKNPIINACYFRGLVINSFIHLESEMSYCLAEYFSGTNDHYWTFTSVIGDRMTFESKRASLKFLMERIETQGGFVKTKNNHYLCRDFFNELRILNEQRNYFAHYVFYRMEARKEFAIVLSDHRDSNLEHFYKIEDIITLLDRINVAANEIVNIYMKFRLENDGPDE
jgi:hypothetical protein